MCDPIGQKHSRQLLVDFLRLVDFFMTETLSYLPFICRFKNFTVEREDGLFVLQTICWPILDFQTNKQCAGSLPDAVLYSPAAQHPAVGLSKRDYWRVGGLSKREQQRWAFALE